MSSTIQKAGRFAKVFPAATVAIVILLLVPATTMSFSDSLPDPLILSDGSPVTTLSEWNTIRRHEIKELFQREMYGYFPEVPTSEFRVVKEDTNVLEGKATYREVEISFEGLGDAVITVALFLPNNPPSSSPLIIGVGICGNHTVLDYDGISLPKADLWLGPCRFFADARGSLSNYWSVEAIIDRGYAFATFHDVELDADRNDDTDGIHGLLRSASIAAAGGDDMAAWGTIGAWAWGASRLVDYAETTDDIDNTRIAIVGHSRRGKAALLAAAFDDRFLLSVPHQAGTGADALSRSLPMQEPVFLMNWTFPYWFSRRFSTYNFRIRKLPIDQHELLALVAPRTVLINAAYSYRWAGFTSSAKAMQAADPVYRLFGNIGLKGSGIITDEDGISEATIGGMTQYRRESGHSLDPDYWRVILDVAGVVFDRR